MRIKTHLTKNLILLILSITIFYGCSDDFVDVESQDQNSENFFNTEEDYQNALVGAYDMLQASYVNTWIGEIASNNSRSGGESAIDVPGLQEIDDMRHTPINSNLQDIWKWMFAGVNRANYILEFKDKIDFPGKENVLAQATFLRAFYYFELVKFFGDVPLAVDERFLFGDQNEVDRTPAAEVYAQIESDLIYAAANLPEFQAQTGRVTKGAAQALLGKVYVYQNKFTEAAAVLDQVINSGVYQLLEDYSTLFENDNENNVESVFEIQYTDLEGASFDCLQCSEGNVAVGFNGVRMFSGPIFDAGFGFNVPTAEAYLSYSEGDLRRDVAILDIEAFAEANQDFNNGAGVSWSEGYKHTGYFNRKYIPRQGDSNIGDQNLTNPNNFRVIRFADVLLLAAEAHSRGTGNDVRALEYVNRVRVRAGLPAINVTGNELTTAIWNERRLELMGEGQHFFDLVRTNRAAESIDGFVVGKHELFPIPLIEIQLAGNRWPQNPGY